MGELLFALSVGLSFGHFGVAWSWAYLAFAIWLFTTRQRADDVACAEKYGQEKWAEYQKKVRYRIIPGIY